ncbi:unnamed protein product [Trichobilharzia regenti]|nr:unnamed protein product [Trichobilharzia regenti]
MFDTYRVIRRKLVTSFMNPSSTTIIERCLWTAQLFSDVYEVKFWRLVANRLLYKKSVNSFTNSPSDKELWSRYFLDLSWDFLADCRLYRQNVENYTSLMEKSHYSSIETMVCVDTLLMIGQPDRAVNLLLETPVDSNLYSLNMHRACLLAANATRKSCLSGPSIDQSVEDTYLSTVKLVATNLLSNGRINEGIGLLCLIGLQIDACRYLESFDQWDRAIWLAKVMYFRFAKILINFCGCKHFYLHKYSVFCLSGFNIELGTEVHQFELPRLK